MSELSESDHDVFNHNQACDIVIEDGTIHTIEVTVVYPNIDDDLIDIENQEEKNLNKDNTNIRGILFKCEKCDFAATKRSNLNDHKVFKHNWCCYCYSSFNSQEYLVTHMNKTHSDKKGLTGTRNGL